MESFFANMQRQWPAGRADCQWDILLDPEPVRSQVMLPYRQLVYRDGLAPVPAAWAHVPIGHVAPAADILDGELEQMAGLAREGCAALAPFLLTVGRAQVKRYGITCPVSPEGVLRRLGTITATATRQASSGRISTRTSACRPQLVVAYALSPQSDRPFHQWLSSHDVTPATLQVSQLALTVQRHDARTITWQHAQAIPLGTQL